MSGHSKWSSIKHQKAVTDARRGQLFTKLAKEIIVAAEAEAESKIEGADGQISHVREQADAESATSKHDMGGDIVPSTRMPRPSVSSARLT